MTAGILTTMVGSRVDAAKEIIEIRKHPKGVTVITSQLVIHGRLVTILLADQATVMLVVKFIALL